MEIDTARTGPRLLRVMHALREKAALLDGPLSLINYLRLRRSCSMLNGAAPIRRRRAAPLSLRVRALKGNRVLCRPLTTDFPVFVQTFVGLYHLPPTYLNPIRRILDLGSNVGFTIAHYATLFPEAQIIGVELDQSNALLCSENIRSYGDRCSLVRGAAWVSDGQVFYDGDEEWGFHVSSNGPHSRRVQAFSMNTLLRMFREQPIDFVKMDIEGAERELLKAGGEWTQNVRCVKVEIHPPYSLSECLNDFQRLGMRAVVERSGGPASVTACWPDRVGPWFHQ